MGKNERTTESNRIDQKPETKKRRDLPILASLLYLTQNDLSTSLALSHARTHAQRPSQAYFHPFFLDYITQKGIPPRHEREFRARNSRPANQSERERERFILSRPYHRVRLHLTSARLISAHRSRRRRRRRERRERRRLSNRLYCAASDPTQFSHPSIQLKGM